jgi:hypothetical protein
MVMASDSRRELPPLVSLSLSLSSASAEILRTSPRLTVTYKRLYFSLEFWIALGRGKISARLQYSVGDEVRNLFEFSWSPVDAYFPVSSLAAVLRFQRYLRVQQFSSIAVGFWNSIMQA